LILRSGGYEGGKGKGTLAVSRAFMKLWVIKRITAGRWIQVFLRLFIQKKY